MELSLYHPERGYYMREDLEWGGKGDFTTAPMISTGFAYALGASGFQLNPKAKIWIELGPGRGDLAEQLLTFYPHIEEYWCIEPSDPTRSRSERLLLQRLQERQFEGVASVFE